MQPICSSAAGGQPRRAEGSAAALPANSLLETDDPPPFTVLRAEGRAALLLICDHASRAVPHGLERLGLDETLLMRHIGWDIGAAEVTRHLAARFDAPAICCG